METTSGGVATTTTFVYLGDAIASESVSSGTTRSFVTDETGRIVKVTVTGDTNSNDNATFLVAWNGHGDALGLWRQNADGSVTLANSYTYTTWGAPTTTVASPFSDLGFRYLYVGASDVQSDNTFGLGLLYMHARHYAPALGRFLQPDPSRADAGLYGYVANNATTRVDPSGLLSYNQAEYDYCISWFNVALRSYECGIAFLITADARELAISTFPHSKRNGKSDALRHCMWQACLEVALGWRLAKKFGDLHEAIDGNPYNEKRMDLHNNIVGRTIGWRIGGPATVRHFLSPCLSALYSDWLVRLSEFSGSRRDE